jgi:hypothetical protein
VNGGGEEEELQLSDRMCCRLARERDLAKGHTKKWKAENAVLGVLLCTRQPQLRYSSEASLLQTLELLRE